MDPDVVRRPAKLYPQVFVAMLRHSVSWRTWVLVVPCFPGQFSYEGIHDLELTGFGCPPQVFDEAGALVGIRQPPGSQHKGRIDAPYVVWSDAAD